MNDTLEAIKSSLVFAIIVVAAIVIPLVMLCSAWNHIYAGTKVEYEGTVQAVTRSSYLAPHTKVILRTYSEDDVHFTLYGYHDFDIGGTIEISMTMKPFVYGLDSWGTKTEITAIERIGG